MHVHVCVCLSITAALPLSVSVSVPSSVLSLSISISIICIVFISISIISSIIICIIIIHHDKYYCPHCHHHNPSTTLNLFIIFLPIDSNPPPAIQNKTTTNNTNTTATKTTTKKKKKKKLKPGVIESQTFAKTVAPADAAFLRKQARLKEAADLEASRLQRLADEEKLLVELHKETRLQRVRHLCKRVIRTLFCCFFPSKEKTLADKYAIKTDAELEADKMKKWLSNKTDGIMVDTLFKVRLIERESTRRYRNFFKWFGMTMGQEKDQSADILRMACLNGRFKEVVDILEDGDYTANSMNKMGDTAFFAVVNRALNGKGELDHDEDKNEVAVSCWGKFKDNVNEFKMKVLQMKPQTSQLDMVLKILTHKGGDVNFICKPRDKNEDGLALIHEAARSNRQGMLDWLSTKNVDVNRLTSLHAKTSLMLAAANGYGEMVRNLLHKGCIDTINNIDSSGCSVLHYAAAHCESEYVKMLLICGADIGVRSKANRLPLEEAKIRQKMQNVEMIMFHKDRSHIEGHRISFFDLENTRLRVEAAQKAAVRAKKEENTAKRHAGGGMLGLGGLRSMGKAIKEEHDAHENDEE